MGQKNLDAGIEKPAGRDLSLFDVNANMARACCGFFSLRHIGHLWWVTVLVFTGVRINEHESVPAQYNLS